MLYVSFALSQGALALSQGAYPYSKSKDTTIIRITKGFFGFLGEIPGQAGNDVGEIPGQARNEEGRARNDKGKRPTMANNAYLCKIDRFLHALRLVEMTKGK